MASSSLLVLRNVSLSLALILTSELRAKGLDSLQPETPSTVPKPSGEAVVPAPQAPATATPAAAPAVPAAPAALGTAPLTSDAVKPAAAPLVPGLQKIYIATGLSWLNLAADQGGWHSSTTGDLEIGHKILQISDRLDLFGTFRYRPLAVDIVYDRRSYRASIEAYLFGAKSHYVINPKLSASAALEVGLVQTHVISVDSLVESDKSLEKSGVDLGLGAGVSYLVLDKLGVGSRLALGSGTYKTLQLGLDVRFLF